MKKIIILFLLIASAAYSNAPSWIETPYKTYSEKTFLSGVGSGNSREAAIDRAYARISEIFGVSVENETVLFDEEMTTESTQRYTSYISDSTKISSKYNLINVEVREEYYDARSSMYYAIVTINKKETVNIIKNIIADGNKQVPYYLSMAGRESDYSKKYKLLDKAATIAETNQELEMQLPHLDDYSMLITHRPAYEIREEANDVKHKITFFINVEHSNNELKRSLEQILDELEIRVVDRSETPLYTIREKTQYTESRASQYGANYIIEYKCRLTIENAKGHTISAFNFDGKTFSKVSIDEAKQRARKAIADYILNDSPSRNSKKEVSDFFVQFIK